MFVRSDNIQPSQNAQDLTHLPVSIRSTLPDLADASRGASRSFPTAATVLTTKQGFSDLHYTPIVHHQSHPICLERRREQTKKATTTSPSLPVADPSPGRVTRRTPTHPSRKTANQIILLFNQEPIVALVPRTTCAKSVENGLENATAVLDSLQPDTSGDVNSWTTALYTAEQRSLKCS